MLTPDELNVLRFADTHPCTISAMRTPIARFAEWLVTREDKLRPCGLDRSDTVLTPGPLCETMITLRSSEAAGHRGFCSFEHGWEDQQNRS